MSSDWPQGGVQQTTIERFADALRLRLEPRWVRRNRIRRTMRRMARSLRQTELVGLAVPRPKVQPPRSAATARERVASPPCSGSDPVPCSDYLIRRSFTMYGQAEPVHDDVVVHVPDRKYSGPSREQVEALLPDGFGPRTDFIRQQPGAHVWLSPVVCIACGGRGCEKCHFVGALWACRGCGLVYVTELDPPRMPAACFCEHSAK